jgi:tRNA (cytidine/uridine-2'-O-)-methyltransferase
MFNVVLVHPDIPHNAGNIGRTCVGLDAKLHLVKPLGFKIEDKYIRRSGLDYWQYLNLITHNSYDEFLTYSTGKRLVFASTKGKILYWDFKFKPDDFIIFGSETKGLPEDIIKENFDRLITIPMPGSIRSLNLSNAVAVILYEAYKQNF